MILWIAIGLLTALVLLISLRGGRAKLPGKDDGAVEDYIASRLKQDLDERRELAIRRATPKKRKKVKWFSILGGPHDGRMKESTVRKYLADGKLQWTDLYWDSKAKKYRELREWEGWD